MRTPNTLPRALGLVALVAALSFGCNDVGDGTGTIGASDDGGADASVESATGDDGAAGSDAAAAEAGSGTDATLDASETSVEEEAASPESGPDAEGVDMGAPEAEAPETGEPEAAADAGTDAGAPEAGADTGGAEAASEAGTVDAAADSAVDANAPTPCTAAPCAASGPNSVQCPANASADGVCTPTEAAIVARDIAQGNLTGGQVNPFVDTVTMADEGSCYSCLNFKSCLDDNAGDTGNECTDAPDLTGQGGGTAGSHGGGSSLCQAVLDCILSSDCQGNGGIAGTTSASSPAVENTNLCYCGGNNAGSVCSASGTVQNGLCVTEEAAGSGFAQGDSKDILANFGSNLYPYGIANHIFQCAAAQKCTICK